MRSALVTGSTGFIGLHLIDRLVSNGWSVVAPVRRGCSAERLAALQRLGCHTPLLSTQGDCIGCVVRKAKPDVVFHLATLFRAQHEAHDVEALVLANILFGAQVLEGVRQQGGGVLVSVGSHWQQFENRPYSPVSLYAATKQAFEDLLQYYTESMVVRAQRLLLTDCYGSGDTRRKLLSVLLDAERTGIPVELTGGEQRIDLLHVDDAVGALIVAANRALADATIRSESWVVRTDRSLRVRELVEVFERIRNSHVPVLWGVRPYRSREAFVPWTAGNKLPGWSHQISLEEGLRGLTV